MAPDPQRDEAAASARERLDVALGPELAHRLVHALSDRRSPERDAAAQQQDPR